MKRINYIENVDAIDGLRTLSDNCINCCITSPPYWQQRDYGVVGQYGMEKTPDHYVEKLIEVFREVRRVLKTDGTVWLNLGDAYWGSGKAGANPAYQKRHTEFGKPSKHKARFGQPTTKKHNILKPKDLIGLPWKVAFALQKDGWYLRQDIIWHKPNPMPESVIDRCTKSHEYIFLLSKSSKYYFNQLAIRKPIRPSSMQKLRQGHIPYRITDKFKSMVAVGQFVGGKKHRSFTEKQFRTRNENGNEWKCINALRNKRSVWTIPTHPFKEMHFATFPERLITDCIRAGTRVGNLILDPFMGCGTTALVAQKLERNYIGFELNPQYVAIANKRLVHALGLFYNINY